MMKVLSKDEKNRIQTLINALSDQHVSVGWNACRDLANIGPDAVDALTILTQMLESKDAHTALWARVAVSHITEEFDKYIQYFITALDDKKRLFPGMASAALACFGEMSHTALPELIKELSDPHPDNRWSAAHAIAGTRGYGLTAVPALGKLLYDPDEKVRWYAAHALSEVYPETADIVPELIHGLDDIDDDVRAYCVITLGRMESIAMDSVPKLQSMLDDSNPKITEQVQLSLSSILQVHTE